MVPDSQIPTVYILRHEKTDLNGDGANARLRGWQDIPLSPEGTRDLKKLTNFFTGHPVKHVVTADLSRHMQTGLAIAQRHGATLTPTASFRPWNNTGNGSPGDWGSRPINKALHAEMRYHIDHPDIPAPHGETFRAAYDRNVGGLQKVLDFARMNPTQHTAVVMSTRGIGASIHYLYGDKRNIVGHDAIHPGGVIRLQFLGGQWVPTILRGNTGLFKPPVRATGKSFVPDQPSSLIQREN